MQITMDGVTYRVRVRQGTLEESFRIEDGPNADTLLTGEQSRDVIGTYYEHEMEVEPDPQHYQDYLDFYQAISAPVDSHTITLPHGADMLTYQAMIYSGSHMLYDTMAGNRRYRSLRVKYKAKAPQRIPE